MSVFLGRPFLSALSPSEVKAAKGTRQLWQLSMDFKYQSDLLGLLVAHAGLTTDLASIPREVFDIIDPTDTCILYPSIHHDNGYTLAGVMGDGRVFTREQFDDMLYEGMLVCGASGFIAAAVRDCVRLFGSAHWGAP